MKNIIKIVYLLSALSLSMFSCKTQKLLENKIVEDMPTAFGSQKDSANSAVRGWKLFFTDRALVDLIETAIKNNLDMSVALQKINVAQSGLKAGKAALFPSVNANLSFWQRKFGYYTMDDAGNRTTEIEPGKVVPTHLPDYFVGFQASWELDVWGKLRNRKKAAVARYLSSIEGKNIVLTNLIADLASNYYALLAFDNQVKIVNESIKLRENALELIKIQKEAGVVNELAVQQFEAEVINTKAMINTLQQEILEIETRINFLLGRYPQPIVRDTSQFNRPLTPVVSVGIPAQLMRNRPDIRQAELELAASRADLNAARAAFFPSLNITGALGFQGYRAALLFSNPQSIAYSALGNLVAPLINRSAIKAEFKAASAYAMESLFNYQKAILNGYVEVYNEIAKIRNQEAIMNLKAQQAEILSRSIQTSSDLFVTGRANYIEVLMAQRGLLASKIELIEVKQRQYCSIVNLYKALGGGWQ